MAAGSQTVLASAAVDAHPARILGGVQVGQALAHLDQDETAVEPDSLDVVVATRQEFAEGEVLDRHAPHRVPIADPVPCLIGVAHLGRPQRCTAVPNPAPGEFARRQRTPCLVERGAVAHRIGGRHRNIVAAKQLIEGILVMAELDGLRRRQERAAGQGLALMKPREQEGIVIVARNDQIDGGPRDHRTQVPVEGARRSTLRIRRRDKEIALRGRPFQHEAIRIAADQDGRGVVVQEAAH